MGKPFGHTAAAGLLDMNEATVRSYAETLARLGYPMDFYEATKKLPVYNVEILIAIKTMWTLTQHFGVLLPDAAQMVIDRKDYLSTGYVQEFLSEGAPTILIDAKLEMLLTLIESYGFSKVVDSTISAGTEMEEQSFHKSWSKKSIKRFT